MSNVDLIHGVTEEDLEKAQHIFRVYDKNSVSTTQEKKNEILKCFGDLIEFEAPFQTPGFGATTATKGVLPWEAYITGENCIITKETKEGVVQAVLVLSPIAGPGFTFAHMSYMWVVKEHRGNLNGSLLLEAAENVAKTKFKCEYLHLSCLPCNDLAYEFYRRNGYTTHMKNMSRAL